MPKTNNILVRIDTITVDSKGKGNTIIIPKIEVTKSEFDKICNNGFSTLIEEITTVVNKYITK